MTERLNRKACLLYPEDRMKVNWDLFITFILLLACVVTPIRIAFDQENDTGWIILDSVVDFLFFVDMVIIFNTAF